MAWGRRRVKCPALVSLGTHCHSQKHCLFLLRGEVLKGLRRGRVRHGSKKSGQDSTKDAGKLERSKGNASADSHGSELTRRQSFYVTCHPVDSQDMHCSGALHDQMHLCGELWVLEGCGRIARNAIASTAMPMQYIESRAEGCGATSQEEH